MARSVFNPADRQSIERRLASLSPDAKPIFGSMTPGNMVCHLTDSVRGATGEMRVSMKKSFMTNPIARHIIIYYLPWPKGKVKTVPELLTTRPADWPGDLARLQSLVEQVAARGPSATWAPHPAFGEISGKDYGVLFYRHFDHHLRQFGV